MAARGVGLATVISIGLHLLVVAALWRPPTPLAGGRAPVMEVVLSPADVSSPPRAAAARARPPSVPVKTGTAARPSPPDKPAVTPAGAAAPSPDSPVVRPVDPGPVVPAPAASPARSVEDPFDAWSREVWAAIDRRRPRGEAGATAARVAFSLDRSGRITALRLAASSGAPAFDREAMRAVRAAAPFPSPPTGIEADRLRFEILIRSAG